MKIAIIGGGNVYALNLARHLDALGIEHFGIGRNPRKAPAFWQVDHAYEYHALHLIDRFDEVMALLDKKRPDIVVNFAAQGESAASFGEHTDWYYATNTLGLVRFAEALRKRDYVRRFIQCGTSEVYGSADRPMKESDPVKPTSPYAISKAAFDMHLQVMHRVHGFPCNVLRPSNAYTPGQQIYRIIPRTIICALSGQRLKLHGDASKSYMHATDLSRAIMATIANGEPGAVYNCGPAEPIRIRDLVAKTLQACWAKWSDVVDEAPGRVGEDAMYWLDSSSMTKATGWYPRVSLEEGLEEMVRWVRAHPEIMSMDPTFRITQ